MSMFTPVNPKGENPPLFHDTFTPTTQTNTQTDSTEENESTSKDKKEEKKETPRPRKTIYMKNQPEGGTKHPPFLSASPRGKTVTKKRPN
jgi:hypothetical protein